MWNRRLGAAFMLVAFWARPLAALPSDVRALDTPQLLAEAARRIESLQALNGSLREEIRALQDKSKELSAKLEESLREREAHLSAIEQLETRLASLQTDWERSEVLRLKLTATLTSLQRSLQRCNEEATAKARRAMLGGVVAGLAVGALVMILWSAH